VVDSEATHHMTSLDRLFSYLETCFRPMIFMGDDSLTKVCGKSRVDLKNGFFQCLLHVLKLSINILSIYQITNSSSREKVEFNPNSIIIFDLSNGSKIVVDEVNQYSRLYSFSHFTHKYDYMSLLTHSNEEYRLLDTTLEYRYFQSSPHLHLHCH